MATKLLLLAERIPDTVPRIISDAEKALLNDRLVAKTLAVASIFSPKKSNILSNFASSDKLVNLKYHLWLDPSSRESCLFFDKIREIVTRPYRGKNDRQ